MAARTTVTATIKDASNNLYANAQVTAAFTPNASAPPGQPILANGSPFQQVANSNTNASGVLSMSLTDLANITPSGSSWTFFVTLGTVGFQLSSTSVTGASVDLSAAFQAAAVPLGVPGDITSVFGRTGVVAAQTGDYTAAQVTNAARTDVGNTFTGHQTIEGVASTGATGTGNLVFATSPALTTPNIGAATATTVNLVTLTQPATGATLTISDTKTLTATNSLTLAGTDSTTMTFPTTSATIARTDAANTFTGNQTIPTVNKVTITAPAAAATLTIANNKTLTANNSLTLAGTDATTMTFPTTSASIARTDAGQAWTGNQTGVVLGGAGSTTPEAVVNRLKASQGSALVAGDFVLSAGWGTTASVNTIAGRDAGLLEFQHRQ